MVKFKSDNLFAKIRYNIQHNGSDLRWKLFIKDGDKDEIMFLVKEWNCYTPQRSYSEIINDVGHYSVLTKANKIVIDDKDIGWIT